MTFMSLRLRFFFSDILVQCLKRVLLLFGLVEKPFKVPSSCKKSFEYFFLLTMIVLSTALLQRFRHLSILWSAFPNVPDTFWWRPLERKIVTMYEVPIDGLVNQRIFEKDHYVSIAYLLILSI